ESAFPEFIAILAVPTVTQFQVRRIFSIVRQVKGDRRRFVEPAVQRLADESHRVRIEAAELLAEIGGPAEASPVVALLAGGNTFRDKMVIEAAAETLAAIGGPREVVALDVWLSLENRRDNAD